MDLRPGTYFGLYRIVSPIGAGGMGQVYAAEDPRLGRKVALKVLPKESTQQPDRVQRFEQEARAASALNHPNILTIYEVGEVEGIHYIATELVEGQTLRHLLPSRMPLRRVIDIASQVASALAAAHAAGIVHRDIKPENIMLRSDGYVKILDFGLAKLIETPLAAGKVDSEMPTAITGPTEPGRIMGTWLYMSPEQVRGQDTDGRTDIWSLGTVIYELLAGKSPFAAATTTDTIVSILSHDPPALDQFGIHPPDELNRILSKTLAKDREERYHSIKDMGLDLKQLSQELDLETITRTTSIHTAIGSRIALADTGPKKSPHFRYAVSALAAVLLLAGSWWGWIAWHARATKAAAPLRQLTYSLLVQKMRDGRPYQDPFLSTGQEIFENGWKFRFNFFPAHPGSLYLLDEGPGTEGKTVLSLMFPLPGGNQGATSSAVSQLAANQVVHTEWYFMDQHQGTEKVWIVWSERPIPFLEEVVQTVAAAQNPVLPPSESGNMMNLIQRYSSVKPVVNTDKALKQTTIQASADVIADAVELEHH
jgi:serine/threonine protein kinase